VRQVSKQPPLHNRPKKPAATTATSTTPQTRMFLQYLSAPSVLLHCPLRFNVSKKGLRMASATSRRAASPFTRRKLYKPYHYRQRWRNP
jgi:hypothetical protein